MEMLDQGIGFELGDGQSFLELREARAQLERVAELQRSLLPPLPENPQGISFGVSYRPLELAGGDYYSVRPLGHGRYRLVVADVAGHDAAAAVVTAMLRMLGGSLYGRLQRPSLTDVAEAVNQLLLGELGGMATFVTGTGIDLDTRTGDVRSINFGHPLPRVLGTDGSVRSLCQASTIPLGIYERLPIEERSDRLEPGESLLLYTDGVIEATDSHGDQLEIEGLDKMLSRAAGRRTAEDLIQQIEQGLIAFEQGARRDDQCLLAARLA
jgi:sigma-B regulation protein RsbU (phosphoserine phosphatase)